MKPAMPVPDRRFDRVVVLVIDGLGIGAMPDVPLVRPNDIGANTLAHVVHAVGTLSLPHLERLGLGAESHPIGVHGVCALGYKGADTYLGHQVLMGSPVPDVPEELFEEVAQDVAAALRAAGHQVEPAGAGLSALVVDGTMVVGDNLESDPLQTYHCVGSLEDQTYAEILAVGEILRSVARVRRVVVMGGGGFRAADVRRCTEKRPTGQCGVVRHLTSGTRPEVQVPTILLKAGFDVALIDKVADVVRCEGAHKEPHVPTGAVLDATYAALAGMKSGLIAVNLQETDLAGHDQSAERYAQCLRLADSGIGRMMGRGICSSSRETMAMIRRSVMTSIRASSRHCWSGHHPSFHAPSSCARASQTLPPRFPRFSVSMRPRSARVSLTKSSCISALAFIRCKGG